MPVQRGEVFDFLPGTDPFGPDQQQERVGLADLGRQFRQPKAAAKRHWREIDTRIGLKPAKAETDGLGQRRILGIEGQENTQSGTQIAETTIAPKISGDGLECELFERQLLFLQSHPGR